MGSTDAARRAGTAAANSTSSATKTITTTHVNLTALLVDRLEQTTWKPLAKDGATLPAAQTALRPARQIVTVGETYDFEIQPSRSQVLWLDVRRGSGEFLLQAPIKLR